MLSPKTKALIIELFTELIQGENTIEQLRIKLNNTSNFDPFILFNSLNKSKTNSLSDKTFLSFITAHQPLSIKLNHIKFFIQFYDSNLSRSINYSEFLNIVLCNSFSKLHKNGYVNSTNKNIIKISNEIYNNFLMIILAEIELVKRIDNKLSELKSNNDFSLAELLKCLGCYNSVIITFNNCLNFFYAESKMILKDDICKLMKRLDIKRNGIIDIWDLEQVFYSPFASPPSNVIVGVPSAFNSIEGCKEGTITLLVNELDGKIQQNEKNVHCSHNENGLLNIKKKQVKQLSRDNSVKHNAFKNGKSNCISKHNSNNKHKKETLNLSTIEYNENQCIRDNNSNKHYQYEEGRSFRGGNNDNKNKLLNSSKSYCHETSTSPVMLYKSERNNTYNNRNSNYNIKHAEPMSTREKKIKSLLNLNINNNYSNKTLRKFQLQTNSQSANLRKHNECFINTNINNNNNIYTNYLSSSTRNIQQYKKPQNIFRSRNVPNGIPQQQQPFTQLTKKEQQFNFYSPLKHNTNRIIHKKGNEQTFQQELFSEEVFIIFLNILLDIETLIEKKKIIQMTSLLDFNIEGIFSLFERPSSINHHNDNNNNNILTPSDFQYGLTCVLGIPITDSDLQLLLSKYDLDNVGGLTYSNFFDMLVPFERVSRNNIEKRKTNYNISQNTLLNIKDFFLFVLETEQKIEKFRTKVQQMYNYKYLIESIFNKDIDKGKQRKISNNQLNEYLQKKTKEVHNKHTHLLFIRLDRDRDGYVTVNDILNELIPQKY